MFMFKTMLAVGTVLLLIQLPATASAAPAATVVLDSLNGKAEVQRAGSTIWKSISIKESLFNNDVIRIAPGGLGRLRWPDKSCAYMHGGSQILINIGPPSAKDKFLNYATIFMGSVFFIINKALPNERREDIQLYTPTAVLTIRGTSFEVGVVPGTGATTIKMVNGTLRVRSMIKNISSYLNAPFKTMVTKETDPIIATTMLTGDIDSLRRWVPGSTLDAEIAAHLSQGKRDRLVITGRLDEQCVVTPFTVESRVHGTWDIARGIPKYLAERLDAEDKHLTVVVADSAAASPDAAAAKAKTRYVISGNVTFFDIVNHAEISVRADEYRERAIGRVTMDLILYDSKDMVELCQTTVMGEFSGKKTAENSWAAIDTLPFNLENGQFAHTLIGTALNQAIDGAVEKLLKSLYE
jgi:hypothetical protein